MKNIVHCSVVNCDKRAVARGWCDNHWHRWKRNGDPLTPAKKGRPAEAPEPRFWAKVTKTETCWLWTGSSTKAGYGQFTVNRKTIMAHRYSYELVNGPIPEGLHMDHLCKVTSCVNPAHLEAVTPYVNLMRADNPSAINKRRTKCKNGHPLSGDNLAIRKNGNRKCIACEKARNKKPRT